MDGNWVCLHRKVVDSAVFSDDWAFRLFMFCVLRASWKPCFFKMRRIERGQFAATFDEMQVALEVERGQLRSGFKKLEAMDCVKTESVANRYTIVTVCNYGVYQDKSAENGQSEPTSDQPATNQQPTDDQPATNQRPTSDQPREEQGEQGKERKEGEQVSKAIARFVPPTVLEVSEHCTVKGYAVDAEAFVAHYKTCGWKLKRGPMKCWRSACVTWDKNSDQFGIGNGKAGKQIGLTLIDED